MEALIKPMHLHQLKYFVAIVETGSVTSAAERCFISQPSISQQLTKLEDSVDKKLFLRVKGKLVLTDAGQILYKQAQKILLGVEEAKRRVNDSGDTTGGVISIGILPTLAPFMLPSTLHALSEKFPEAMVTVREDISEVLVESAQRGELDILIDVLPFSVEHLDVELLFQDEFYLAVHCENPIAKLESIALNSIEDESFILMGNVHCLTQQIEHYCFSKYFTPKVLFHAAQISSVKQLIKMQYGVSILPGISITEDSDSAIRYIKLEGEKLSREVVLATTKDRYLGPASEYFVAAVREQYQR